MAPAAGAKKKASKSKRSGAGIDFKKVKHKVGRKIPASANATKVEFKSKKIVVQEQSVKVDKDGLAVNQRNKTLKELFTQIAHYNARVRKEALIGIKDLFLRHPKELECNVTTSIQKLSSRFTDVDKSSRHALLLLLQEIFPAISKDVMKPSISLVMAHLGTAMTHMANDIRLDAFSFLDLLLLQYPLLLVPTFAIQIVEHYTHFLQNDGTHRFDPTATLTVVSSLSRFLSALRSSSPSDSTCTAETSQTWSQKYVAHELRPLHGYKTIWADISDSRSPKSSADHEGLCISMSALLVDVLLKCWAELAPTVCSSPLPDAVGLECMVSITRCLCLLFEWLERLSDGAQMRLELRNRFLFPCSGRLMASFPLAAPAIRTVAKVEECLGALNAGVCETMLHFLIPDLHDFSFDSVLCYYESALLGKLLPLSAFSFSGRHHKGMELCIKSLISFAPLVFECVELSWKTKVLQVVTDAFDRSTPASSTKLACLTAMSKILLSERHNCKDTFFALDQFSKKWLQSFPRLLWELKGNQPAYSKIILDMILCLGKFAVAGSTLSSDFGTLHSAMIPFFCTVLTSKETPERYLYGPFLKLPRDCQETAVDILYYLSDFQPFFLKALLACCLSPEIDLQVLKRLLEVVQLSFVKGRVEVANFLSFLLTLVVAEGVEKMKKKQWIILGVVCRSLFQIGDTDVVLNLLAKPLAEHLVSRASPVLLASSLHIIATLSKDLEHLEIPDMLLNLLPSQTATFMVSQLLAKDEIVMTITRSAVILLFKNKQFARSLMKDLSTNLQGSKSEVYAVGVLTNQICMQQGIERHLEFADISEIFRAVNTILRTGPVEQKQLLRLETTIRAAFGSQVPSDLSGGGEVS